MLGLEMNGFSPPGTAERTLCQLRPKSSSPSLLHVLGAHTGSIAGVTTRWWWLFYKRGRDAGVMQLLRSLIFAEVQMGCQLVGSYIDTHANHLADDLSRNRVLSFLSKVPTANPTATPVPHQLLDLLLNPLTWVSLEWRHRFSDTFRRV